MRRELSACEQYMLCNQTLNLFLRTGLCANSPDARIIYLSSVDK
jgi:hypothetical protein